jgi:hypothetical protein
VPRQAGEELRGGGKTHRQALRQLANRWTAILHARLQRGQLYDQPPAGSTCTLPPPLDTFQPWGI